MSYAAPPPSAQPPMQPPPMPKNGFGITALCLAVPGILFGFVPITGFIGFLLGALALLFGLLGLRRVRRGQATNRVMSWFGVGLGAVSVALGAFAMTLFFQALGELDRDIERLGAPPAVQRVGAAPATAAAIPPASDDGRFEVSGRPA